MIGGTLRSMSRSLSALLIAAAATGCTTLGPMPATTGVSPIPAPRPGAELSIGPAPGYYLSSAVKEEPSGDHVDHAAALLDLGALIGLPGLIVGGRYVAYSDPGGYPGAMIGYRRFLDDAERLSAAAVAYGGHGSGDDNGASYEATHGGLELATNLQLTPPSRWLELHLFGSASVTALSAEGEYCVESPGDFATDCPEPPTEPIFDQASASGVYPAGVLGAAVATGRHLAGPLHGARLAVQFAGGFHPRVESGEQQAPASYLAFGFTLSVGVGATE